MPAPTPTSPITPDRFQMLVEAVQDYAIFMLDPGGHISSWNAGAQQIKGYAASEVIGRHLSIFYPDEARERRWPDEELRRAAASGRYEEEGWRVRKDGSVFWASVVITALREVDGTLAGFAKVTRDLTERRRQEDALRQSEERFRLLVEGVRDYAVYMLDPGGVIQSWNAGAELIKGYRADEVVGRHYRMFFRTEDRSAGLPEKELADALRLGRTEEEGWRVRRDGSTFWANIVMTPIRGPEGGLRGFAKVTRDMTERLRLQHLESSSRRMNEFLAMLAHELRNPLAPIRNAVSILQMEPAPSPSLRAGRDMVDRQLTHLTRLVDDLLDAGRLTSGKIRIKPTRVSFSAVAAHACESMRPQMEARGHRFELLLPSGEIHVNADETRLAQVLQNLLGNAAKFTPNGGRISLAARCDAERLHVDVQDDGAGFSAQHAEGLFELFSQGNPSSTARDGGLGIGLALARSLVEMHGGSLTARSDGPGLGSVFSFELPGASMSAAAGDEAAARPEVRVLVVDDNRDAADSMAEVLRLMGYRVWAAYDAARALEVAQREQPAAVFLDFAMPEINGAELLRQMRQLPGFERLYAVAVSGYNMAEALTGRADFSTFDARLQKPVDFAALRNVLSQFRVEA